MYWYSYATTPAISIHALLAESDVVPCCRPGRATYFYPRSPCGERPSAAIPRSPNQDNFYPRSPCGERHGLVSARHRGQIISIHALLAESDHGSSPPCLCSIISIHALLAESDHYDNYNLHCVEISIHALLAESDEDMILEEQQEQISIHALLAESDCMILTQKFCASIFLSTLSLRRATTTQRAG